MITYMQFVGINSHTKKVLSKGMRIVVKSVDIDEFNRELSVVTYDDYSEHKSNQKDKIIDIIDNVRDKYYYIDNIKEVRKCFEETNTRKVKDTDLFNYNAFIGGFEGFEPRRSTTFTGTDIDNYITGPHDDEMDEKLKELGLKFDGSSTNAFGTIIYRVTINGKKDWLTKRELLRL